LVAQQDGSVLAGNRTLFCWFVNGDWLRFLYTCVGRIGCGRRCLAAEKQQVAVSSGIQLFRNNMGALHAGCGSMLSARKRAYCGHCRRSLRMRGRRRGHGERYSIGGRIWRLRRPR